MHVRLIVGGEYCFLLRCANWISPASIFWAETKWVLFNFKLSYCFIVIRDSLVSNQGEQLVMLEVLCL